MGFGSIRLSLSTIHPPFQPLIQITAHSSRRTTIFLTSARHRPGKEEAPMAPTDSLVSVEQVTRRFPLDHSAVTALDQVNLRIDSGEFLAISGPSGSGKSTLLNLIGCIDKPTSGRILIAGVDTSPLSPSQTSVLRREKIGFVFQTFNLIPVFTASENVEYPLLIQGVSANERSRR